MHPFLGLMKALLRPSKCFLDLMLPVLGLQAYFWKVTDLKVPSRTNPIIQQRRVQQFVFLVIC